MSNAYDIADMSGDPLYILMCREDDELDAESLESAYLAGNARARTAEGDRYMPRDRLGAAPYELAQLAMGPRADSELLGLAGALTLAILAALTFPAIGPRLVGGVLLTIGLFTRPVAFILSGLMAFAFFIAHFPRGYTPIGNAGEAAYLFCFIFLYLAISGPGPISVDERRRPAEA